MRRHRSSPTPEGPEPADAADIGAGGFDAVGLDETTIVPWPMLLRRRLARRVGIDPRWAVVMIVLSGLFTVGITITILVVSLEQIAGDLHSNVVTMNWSITGPMLAFGVVGPAFGKAGDLWGHKRLFVGGLLVAGGFALATTFAWDAWSMIAFRTLSSSAGSACGPAAMAYINRLFSPEERVRPLSYWNFVGAGAPVLGVVAGAPLVATIGWRVIFAVQAPMCLIAALVGWWLLPSTTRATHGRFDVGGAVTFGISAVSLLAGISQGPSWGFGDPRTLALFAISVVTFAIFLRIERRIEFPLIVVSWFRTRNIALPIIGLGIAEFCYIGAFIIAPQVLSRGLGMTEGAISTIIISRPIAFSLMAPLGGLLAVHFGERIMAVSGMAILAGSMLLWVPLNSSDQTLLLVAALATSGIALGAASPSLSSLVSNAVDPDDIGVAGAMQQLVMQLGSVLGAVVLTSIGLDATREHLRPFHTAFVASACIAVVGMAVVFFVRSTPRPQVSSRAVRVLDAEPARAAEPDDVTYDDVIINP